MNGEGAATVTVTVTAAAAPVLTINPELIRAYAAGASEWGIEQLITLFDFQRRQMQRAEAASAAAWHHTLALERRQAQAVIAEAAPTARGRAVTKRATISSAATADDLDGI